ncbi:hypothetical protein ACQ5SO_19360 [Rhodovulum sp. DZ06]|uniref:hypothetical protein n=1 Tax=Rhodovulum sp. DZ06 TaxID=3425126 RepID=UPI003D3583EB
MAFPSLRARVVISTAVLGLGVFVYHQLQAPSPVASATGPEARGGPPTAAVALAPAPRWVTPPGAMTVAAAQGALTLPAAPAVRGVGEAPAQSGAADAPRTEAERRAAARAWAASDTRIAAIALPPEADARAAAEARRNLHVALAELDRRGDAGRDLAFYAPLGPGRAAPATLGYCRRAGADALDCQVYDAPRAAGIAPGARRRLPIAALTDWTFARAGKWEGAFALRAKLPLMTRADRDAVLARLAEAPGRAGGAQQTTAGAP